MPESIYQAQGTIQNGTFSGRWHFGFGDYYDPEYTYFGTLRVFNGDTLTPGAVWPLHSHRDNEVVTYCAEGEFKHADERGEGGILKKGYVRKEERTNRFLPLISNAYPDALSIVSDAHVFSCFLQSGMKVVYTLRPDRGDISTFWRTGRCW